MKETLCLQYGQYTTKFNINLKKKKDKNRATLITRFKTALSTLISIYVCLPKTEFIVFDVEILSVTTL